MALYSRYNIIEYYRMGCQGENTGMKPGDPVADINNTRVWKAVYSIPPGWYNP
jgi:hypothetical protein